MRTIYYVRSVFGRPTRGAAPDPQKTLPRVGTPARSTTPRECIDENNDGDIAPGMLQHARSFECYLAREGVSHNHAGR